ncbi:MAG: L-dopachrome tautomerase-related protein [Anaerolineales bacterium]|jgi:sugar lactone lactonase YvrE
MSQNVGDYGILFHWSRLDWLFDDEQAAKEFYENEYWKGTMPAGFKNDKDGNYYLSVPRWEAGIPATVSRIEVVDGKAMLRAYPSWEMNTAGDVSALQSVLGWEIDELNRAWFLDQGHIQGAPCKDGAQKIVCWDISSNELVESIPVPDEIASYEASFLNDLVVDNLNGFVYIADSGIFTDPLQGGLIVYNMQTKALRRVLHQHESTQDKPGYWFKIAGKRVWKDRPMRTGADGIALSADRKTLYWCALTARNLYCIDTALLQDYATPQEEIAKAVVDLGDKGTNTDGMGADNLGNIYYTMLEGKGIGIYDPDERTFSEFVNDERMIWVDGMTFDNKGSLIFNSNRLHELFQGDLDWDNPYNLIVWKAYLGEGMKSYLYYSK